MTDVAKKNPTRTHNAKVKVNKINSCQAVFMWCLEVLCYVSSQQNDSPAGLKKKHSKCLDGRAAHLPAAERKARGTSRGWGALACSWRRRTPPPGRQSPGRGPRRSAAPRVTPRNCGQRGREERDEAECHIFSQNRCERDADEDTGRCWVSKLVSGASASKLLTCCTFNFFEYYCVL